MAYRLTLRHAASLTTSDRPDLSIQHEIASLFRQWLGTDKALEYLRGCSANILKEPASAGLPDLELLTDFIQDNCFSGTEELAQELAAFILDSYLPAAQSRPSEMNLLLQGQYQVFLSHAAKRFFLNMQDRSRSRDSDPVKYLYRRYRQVLSASRFFQTGKLPSSGMWYAPKKAESVPEASLSSTGLSKVAPIYSEWDFPDSLFDSSRAVEKQLFKADTLLDIAGFFWGLARKHGMAHRLPVRELVNYTAVRFPWLNRPELIPVTGQPEAEGSAGFLPEETLSAPCYDTSSRPEDLAALAMSVKSISAMALEFVSTHSPDGCAVFLLRMQDPPVKFRHIAEKMNFRDHNQASTVYRNFTSSLTEFVSMWPGPGLDELPEEAGSVFIEEVKRWCRKRTGRP